MAQEQQGGYSQNSNSVEQPSKGLYTDVAPVSQPPGTYRFALNAVGNLSSENSNELYTKLPEGFMPIGSVYIDNNQTCIFSVNTKTNVSEIGIFTVTDNINSRYETWCNDENSNSEEKLNFKINKQIQATYRLRRGCEKMVYWTDNYNVPRQVNLNNKNLYKNNIGIWDANKFSLIKKYKKIPVCSNVEILENQGNIQPGTVSVLLQYSDEEKNFSRFVLEVSNVLIYDDNTKQDFSLINGSINIDNQNYNYGRTKKAIKLDFDNFDDNYPFYRLAFVHYGNNNLSVSEVYLSDLISTKQKSFIYNGYNSFEKTDLEYVNTYNINTYISKAKTITQKDNRLILGNITNSDLDFSNLQKYASQINVDCVYKKSSLTNIRDNHNTKNPLSKIFGTGFIPGEVYSLGIVYVFEDGFESPVFHIPGKNNKVLKGHIYNNSVSSDYRVFPMTHSSLDKKSISNNITNYYYSQAERCNNFDYWGVDSFGESLLNTPVRHHRFPTKKDLNLNPFEKEDSNSTYSFKRNYLLSLDSVTEEVANKIKECSDTVKNIYCNNPIEVSFDVLTNKDNNTDSEKISFLIYPDNNYSYSESKSFFFKGNERYLKGRIKGNIKLRMFVASYESVTELLSTTNTVKINLENLATDTDGSLILPNSKYVKEEQIIDENTKLYKIYYEETLENNINVFTPQYPDEEFAVDAYNYLNFRGVKIKIEQTIKSETINSIDYSNYILGISLSNVKIPSKSETGKECVGYYIVKQERRNEDKTFLDSGLVLPMWDTGQIKASTLVAPDFSLENNKVLTNYPNDVPQGVFNKSFSLLSPRHKFHNITFDNFTHIVEQGYYKVSNKSFSGLFVQNVNEEKTEDAKDSHNAFRDGDGATLKSLIVSNEMTYYNEDRGNNKFILENDGNIDIFNLDPCEYGTTEGNKDFLYNFDMSNKKLIFYSKKGNIKGLPEFNPTNNERKYPYVYIYNNHNNYYQTFRTANYSKLENNISKESTFISFNGDYQIGGLREYNTIYGNTVTRMKKSKTNWLQAFAGAIIIAVGIVAGLVTGGLSTVTLTTLGLSLIGATFYGVAAVVKTDSFNKAMREHWEKGLKKTIVDYWFAHIFFQDGVQGSFLGYQDDTIRWHTEIYGDIIFETDINISLRINPKNDPNNFLKPFSPFMVNKPHRIARSGCQGESLCVPCNSGSGGTYYWEDNDVVLKAESTEEVFFLNKYCKINDNLKNAHAKSDVGWEFRGIPIPVLYFVNNDYQNNYGVLKHMMTPFEYSFCSNCREDFPQRFMWSEVSHSESLSDNYKTFLHNNYKDITGEYGEITNIFDFNNNLYIHTTGSLFVQPTNYQERVTNGVVSYIGTGEFGSLPAQHIINDKNGSSAGLQHREGFVLTPYGYFFVSEKEKKVFLFDGKLKDLSLIGMSKWFNENITIQTDKVFKDNNLIDYEFKDNPASPFGTGFILEYDPFNERILVTKKDALIHKTLFNKDKNIRLSYNKNLNYIENYDFIKNTMLGNDTENRRNLLREAVITDNLELYNENYKNLKYNFKRFYNGNLYFQTTIIENLSVKIITVYFKSKNYTEEDIIFDNSWTISYSLKNQTWTSFHSYRPNFYIRNNNKIFSLVNLRKFKDIEISNEIYAHNKKGEFLVFYKRPEDFIIEYVSNDNPLITKIYNHIRFLSVSEEYKEDTDEWIDKRFFTFNKLAVYNSRQCSGILNIIQKNNSNEDYLTQNTSPDSCFIDRNERDWLINDFRDYVIDYSKSIWDLNKEAINNDNYSFIDKVIKQGVIDINKDWYHLESFRDKFLVIRLIFDNFAEDNKNTRITFFVSSENNNISQY